jgi:hypothetical protein
MPNESAFRAVGIVDDLIRNPQKRRQFRDDPEATLRSAGVDPDDVPAQVWRALTHMTLDELTAIAVLGVALSESGMLDGGHGTGHVV